MIFGWIYQNIAKTNCNGPSWVITKKFNGRSKEKNISHVQTFRGSFQEFGRFLSLLHVQEGFQYGRIWHELIKNFQSSHKIGIIDVIESICCIYNSCLCFMFDFIHSYCWSNCIIHRSLIFSSTPIGTIIFCLYVINGLSDWSLSLFGILCLSIWCMVI